MSKYSMDQYKKRVLIVDCSVTLLNGELGNYTNAKCATDSSCAIYNSDYRPLNKKENTKK